MTGKTHRVGGMLCALGGYVILKEKGLLLKDTNPLLQLTIMYPFAIYGSVLPDLDHTWNSSPSKDIVSYLINRVLHLSSFLGNEKTKKNFLLNLFDADHRSWQTHSDLFLVVMLFLAYRLLNIDGINGVDALLIRLVFTGLIFGVISHLVLDMLTPEGIWCIGFTVLDRSGKKKLPKKIHTVPKSSFYATGGKWETLVRNIMWVSCFILLLVILYDICPYRVVFN